jgi:uncharacterized protein (DUF302 family)
MSTYFRYVKLAFVLASFLAAQVAWGITTDNNQMRTVRSRYGYAKTFAMVMQGLKKQKFQIKMVVDHKQLAGSIGAHINNVTSIYFANLKYGIKMIQANPVTALFLPLSLVVWQKNSNHVYISYWNPITNVAPVLSKSDTAAMAAAKKVTDSMQMVLQPIITKAK